MKRNFKLLVCLLAAFSISLSARELDDRDMDAIRAFVEKQSSVALRKKDVNLTVGGDIRMEFDNIHEKINGIDQRGFNDGVDDVRYGNNQFEGQFNFIVDYQADKAWASAWMRYKNFLGSKGFGGTFDNLSMRKLMVGYHFIEGDAQSLDAMVGRTKGFYVFDSEVMFGQNYDGAFVDYRRSFDKWFAMQVVGGPFVIDSGDNHYGWVGELAFNEIANTGLYFKTAYVDWKKTSETFFPPLNTMIANNPLFAYQVWQFLLGYKMNPEVIGVPVKFYGAYGINTAAKKYNNADFGFGAMTIDRKYNNFWYAGIQFNEIEKKGDWAAVMRYESVGLQAVPDEDVNGVGTGNVRENRLYGSNANILTGAAVVPGPSYFGNTNYKGWVLEGAYAITDNLVAKLEYDESRALKKSIGAVDTRHHFRQVELELVYAF